MNNNNDSSVRRSSVWIWLVALALLAVGAIGIAMWPVDHVSQGSSRREFTMEVDFDKFRQIMVRKNATEAIVTHSGMQLLEELVDDVSVALPQQDRPILNAILGQANANLSAKKRITVSVDDPAIGVDKLTLHQTADIQPDSMDVQSNATEPVGNLQAYATRLRASKAAGGTKVELAIDQTIRVKLPRIFGSAADRRVQKAADNSTAEQEQAIRDFIAKFENEVIVLPELR
jgi:hypothetical protein